MLRGFLSKLKRGLARTRGMFAGVAELFGLRGKVDQAFLDRLEQQLYLADVGPQATSVLIERVRQAFQNQDIGEDVQRFVRQQLREMLGEPPTGLPTVASGPTVVLVAGVNGAGKTTTIAKLAKRCRDENKKVLVAACDTFRAAAVEQLTIWSERIGCDIVKAQTGSDPAAVAHDACEKARVRGFDVLIVDTAGRLHTQEHLMRELDKIRRVVSKQIDGAPHETLLVLDATTGQNAVVQAEKFTKVAACTGLVLTKLDGSAKGGAIFSIQHKLRLPVKFVGVGEGIDDLELFDPDAFIEALFE